jgi:Adenylate and Guanylate cyclase catalytic domain
MRFGIHSGPVTAGVLRSQNARFQLFGDTVNTAARMESNGAPGMVHISQETANELTARGKSSQSYFRMIAIFIIFLVTHLVLSRVCCADWFYPRAEKISAKGKGELQTYWLDLSAASMDDRMSVSTGSFKMSMSHQTANDRRMVRHICGRPVALADVQGCRLVDWIVDTLSPMLSRIVSNDWGGRNLECCLISGENVCLTLVLLTLLANPTKNPIGPARSFFRDNSQCVPIF